MNHNVTRPVAGVNHITLKLSCAVKPRQAAGGSDLVLRLDQGQAVVFGLITEAVVAHFAPVCRDQPLGPV